MKLLVICLCPFSALATNPLAHIWRAVNQYNPFILAVTQESYNLNVHESDFPQVEDYANTVIIHLFSYVADMGGLNSATEPQNHGMSVRFVFDLQHWSTIPFGRGRGRPIRDHVRPGEAVGIDSANPSGSAGSPDGSSRSYSLCRSSTHHRSPDFRIHVSAVSGYARRAPFVIN